MHANNLIDVLLEVHDKMQFVLDYNQKQYPLHDVTITKSSTPVTSPTLRGGVYFSDKFAYRVKGVIYDISIIPSLSKAMLGPNTEFAELKITSSIIQHGNAIPIHLIVNLTNSMQSSAKLELNMIIVRLESSLSC